MVARAHIFWIVAGYTLAATLSPHASYAADAEPPPPGFVAAASPTESADAEGSARRSMTRGLELFGKGELESAAAAFAEAYRLAAIPEALYRLAKTEQASGLPALAAEHFATYLNIFLANDRTTDATLRADGLVQLTALGPGLCTISVAGPPTMVAAVNSHRFRGHRAYAEPGREHIRLAANGKIKTQVLACNAGEQVFANFDDTTWPAETTRTGAPLPPEAGEKATSVSEVDSAPDSRLRSTFYMYTALLLGALGAFALFRGARAATAAARRKKLQLALVGSVLLVLAATLMALHLRAARRGELVSKTQTSTMRLAPIQLGAVARSRAT